MRLDKKVVDSVKAYLVANKATLLAMDVHQIDVRYAGCGDEGFIEDVDCFNAIGEDIDVVLPDHLDDLLHKIDPPGYGDGLGGGGIVTCYVDDARITHASYDIVEQHDENEDEEY